jgi:hypothetical protein
MGTTGHEIPHGHRKHRSSRGRNVRTFPNPDSGQCWNSYSGDVARILSQYDDLLNNYCIDMKRVFGIAHSSADPAKSIVSVSANSVV